MLDDAFDWSKPAIAPNFDAIESCGQLIAIGQIL